MEIFAFIYIIIVLAAIIMGLVTVKNNPKLTKRERVNYSLLIIIFPILGNFIYYFLKAKK